MFALWYLSLGVDEIRKRCHGAPLILTQKTAAEGPKKEVPAAKPKADPVPPKPAPPIQPLKPIEIPKDSDSERLKQLESPETVELIKSFEKINGDQSNGEGNSSSSKKEDIKQDPVVPIKKPEPKTPEPKKPEPKKPSPQIEVPSKPPANPEMAFPGMKPKADTLKKDLKDATQSFLAEELGGGGGQPKQAKRYSKSRQKNH